MQSWTRKIGFSKGVLRLSLPVLICYATAAQAQQTANWRDFEICSECKLELTEVVRLGDVDGLGMIESANPTVTWSAEVGYTVVGPTFFQVFDDNGRFLRRVGREGDGPGEFRGAGDVHVVGGQLVALDYAKRAWVIFDTVGQFVDQRRYGFVGGQFVPVGGSQVVVVAMDRSPSVVGYPLHLVDIESGAPSLHFGSTESWVFTPYAENVKGSMVSRPGTVWWGTAASPRVQEWSVSNQLLRVIEGELPWFPEVTELIDPTQGPPSTLLQSLALDDGGRLWMTVRIADPEWRDVEVIRDEEGPYVPSNRRIDYLDTRLDIFDLQSRRHLGSYFWDNPNGSIFDLGGEPAIRIVEYTEETLPQVVIYRIGWEQQVSEASASPSPDFSHP